MECGPIASAVVVRLAVPPESVPVPMVVTPSLNVTVPVGVPAPGATAATVAVNVSDWPKTEGFGPVVRATVVVVLAWLTVCETVLELLGPKRAVPPYEAVRLWDPAVRVETVSVATPAPFRVPVPSDVAPSRNITVPVGVVGPVTRATVAVSVVDWPNVDGLAELVSVVVVFSTTTRVPEPVAVPAWQVPPPFAARTVKLVEPGGVAFVVPMVKVDVALPPVLVTELGLNEAVAPVGSAVVTLRGEVHELPLPLKLTVTVYAVELPGATVLGDWGPTVTVLGFESVKVFCACTPDWLPTAVK
jgi:hypothetical protein